MDKIERIIYQFWVNDEPPTENRMRCIENSRRTNLPFKVLMKDDIQERMLEKHPYHEAYQYLFPQHKADYLRCYFMHHFGGGYADIKEFSEHNNWIEQFDLINNNPEIQMIGQMERIGGSPIGPEHNGEKENFNDDEHNKYLTQVCWFIVRPHSDFTTRWYTQLNSVLDSKLEMLKKCSYIPKIGKYNNDYDYNMYQIRWGELLGEIVHRIQYQMHNDTIIKNSLVSGASIFNYR